MATIKDRCQFEEQLGPDPAHSVTCGARAVDCPNCGQPNVCMFHLEVASHGKQVCFACEAEYERLLAPARPRKAAFSERSKWRTAS